MGPGMDEEMMEYGGLEEPYRPEQALVDHKLLDLLHVEGVEVHLGSDNHLWINIDGKCVVRVQYARHLEVKRDPKPPRANWPKSRHFGKMS